MQNFFYVSLNFTLDSYLFFLIGYLRTASILLLSSPICFTYGLHRETRYLLVLANAYEEE